MKSRMQRLGGLGGVMMVLWLALAPQSSMAVITMKVTQTGADVVMTVSGSAKGITPAYKMSSVSSVYPSGFSAYILLGGGRTLPLSTRPNLRAQRLLDRAM